MADAGRKIEIRGRGFLAPPARLLLHPLVVASCVWLTVGFLYAAHFSRWLIYSTSEAFRVIGLILVPIAVASLLCWGTRLFYGLDKQKPRGNTPAQFERFNKRLNMLFRIWVAITVVEIIATGGLPIVWVFTAPAKSYVDFGIPSIHGFANSMLFAIMTAHCAMFLVTREKRHRNYLIFAMLWSMLVISRAMTLIYILQFSVLFLRLRPVRVKLLVRIGGGMLLFLLLFGMVGDLRQRNTGQVFKDLAQPSETYPDWAPSSLLWSYIYTATPLNNLLNTIALTRPQYDLRLPNSSAILFPTVLRKMIYGGLASQETNGTLVIATFTAATAYVSIYQDLGLVAIAGFSFLSSLITNIFWYRRDLRGVLIFTFLCGSLVLTLFFNNFLSLPTLMQSVWFVYFTARPMEFNLKTARLAPASET